MSKSKKSKKSKEEREHEEFILEQIQAYGRQPTPPPSKYHERKDNNQRKNRKRNKQELKDIQYACNRDQTNRRLGSGSTS
jgi:hypothetical protein